MRILQIDSSCVRRAEKGPSEVCSTIRARRRSIRSAVLVVPFHSPEAWENTYCSTKRQVNVSRLGLAAVLDCVRAPKESCWLEEDRVPAKLLLCDERSLTRLSWRSLSG
uniref:Uncharacterized protein n=1 Tax=Zea mays TaxID=4577 RepID=A0A804PVJ4_MAIZE